MAQPQAQLQNAKASPRPLSEGWRRAQGLAGEDQVGAGSCPVAKQDLQSVQIAVNTDADRLLALSEALDDYAAQDPVGAELVKLRYFVGLTVADAAELLGISRATADRTWAYARAWLYRRLAERLPQRFPSASMNTVVDIFQRGERLSTEGQGATPAVRFAILGKR